MKTTRELLFPVSFSILVILFAAANATGQAKVINAKVLEVTDGSTLLIRDYRGEKHKVGLKAIKAPDLSAEFGSSSREYLSQLVNGKWVRIVDIKYDRSGKLIGKVMSKGRDISLEMVIAGFASHLTGFAHEQTEAELRVFEAAEKNAIRSKFNIWAVK